MKKPKKPKKPKTKVGVTYLDLETKTPRLVVDRKGSDQELLVISDMVAKALLEAGIPIMN